MSLYSRHDSAYFIPSLIVSNFCKMWQKYSFYLFRWNYALPSWLKKPEMKALRRASWKLPKQERGQSTLFSGMKRWDSGWTTGSLQAPHVRWCNLESSSRPVYDSCNIFCKFLMIFLIYYVQVSQTWNACNQNQNVFASNFSPLWIDLLNSG